jgi:hypothetical protein
MSIELPREVSDVRKALEALKAEIELKKEEGEEEKPEDRSERLKTSLGSVMGLVIQMRAKRAELESKPDGATNPVVKQLKDLEISVVKEIVPSDDPMELLSGIMEKDVTTDPTTGALVFSDELLKDLQATDVDDEITAFRATMTTYEKVEDKVTKFYNMLPEGVRSTLDSIGVGTQGGIAFIMQFIADWLDGMGNMIGRTFSRTIREGAAVKKAMEEAVAKGITNAQELVEKARVEWRKAYNEWMKKGVGAVGMPDFLEYFQKEYDKYVQNKADEDLRAKNAALIDGFKTYASTHLAALFGADIAVSTVNVGTTFAAKRSGAAWEMSMDTTGFEKMTDESFVLTDKTKKLVALATQVKDQVDIQNVALGELSLTADTLTATDADPATLTKLLLLRPTGGTYNKLSLISSGVRAASTAQLAEFKDGALAVNAATSRLDGDVLTKLKDTVHATTKDALLLEYKANPAGAMEWIEVTA